MRHLLLAVLLLPLLAFATPSLAERRVALVLGNSNYDNVPTLPNPDADAAAIAQALKDTGFDVIMRTDLDQKGMAAALSDFAAALVGADVGLFYYAGHAIQYDSQNYLISTNAELDNPFALNSDAIPLAQIVASMQASARINLVLLDACRNNPFVDRLKQSLPASRSVAVSRGLAPVSVDASDTMVVYATSANQTASDGTGEHSPFTQALLNHIETPGLEISLVMKRVIQDVREATLRQQNPEVLSRMASEFYFVPGEPPAAEGPGPSQTFDAVTEAFRQAMAIGTADAWRSFIQRYPDSSLSGFALDALERVDGKKPAPDSSDVANVPPPEESRSGTIEDELPPLVTPEPTAVSTVDPRELTVLVQAELNRIGCDVGTPDGIWGRKSQAGLTTFARETKQSSADLEISEALLTLLKGQQGRVCPVVCSPTQNLVGDQCVRKTCPSGQRLSNKGICYTPVAATPTKKAAPVVEVKKEAPVIEVEAPKKKFPPEPPASLCSLC